MLFYRYSFLRIQTLKRVTLQENNYKFQSFAISFYDYPISIGIYGEAISGGYLI